MTTIQEIKDFLEVSDFNDEDTDALKLSMENFCGMHNERMGYVHALELELNDCDENEEQEHIDLLAKTLGLTK